MEAPPPPPRPRLCLCRVEAHRRDRVAAPLKRLQRLRPGVVPDLDDAPRRHEPRVAPMVVHLSEGALQPRPRHPSRDHDALAVPCATPHAPPPASHLPPELRHRVLVRLDHPSLKGSVRHLPQPHGAVGAARHGPLAVVRHRHAVDGRAVPHQSPQTSPLRVTEKGARVRGGLMGSEGAGTAQVRRDAGRRARTSATSQTLISPSADPASSELTLLLFFARQHTPSSCVRAATNGREKTRSNLAAFTARWYSCARSN